ncbi:hypothetical protein BN3660_03501 [Eubacteriaceae bacterium CHKCI004]|nr:hypothetical protein BN3660_03501 [Eubacteriaceae bacterium CHKCI004]
MYVEQSVQNWSGRVFARSKTKKPNTKRNNNIQTRRTTHKKTIYSNST